jgi:hypothetical protein
MTPEEILRRNRQKRGGGGGGGGGPSYLHGGADNPLASGASDDAPHVERVAVINPFQVEQPTRPSSLIEAKTKRGGLLSSRFVQVVLASLACLVLVVAALMAVASSRGPETEVAPVPPASPPVPPSASAPAPALTPPGKLASPYVVGPNDAVGNITLECAERVLQMGTAQTAFRQSFGRDIAGALQISVSDVHFLSITPAAGHNMASQGRRRLSIVLAVVKFAITGRSAVDAKKLIRKLNGMKDSTRSALFHGRVTSKTVADIDLSIPCTNGFVRDCMGTCTDRSWIGDQFW